MNSGASHEPVKLTFQQVVEHFNLGIKEAENFLSPARSSALQLEQCFALDVLSYNAARFKQNAARHDDEDQANLFLGYECVIGAVRSQLLMWLLLKRDMPNEAWDRLVAAQMGCLDATRAHIGFVHCEQRLQELYQLEEQIFPRQVFVSAGFVSSHLDCSVCRQRYSKCAHLRGKPYMGQFCEVIHRNIRGDHVSLVETPADKRCRVVSFKTKDGHRDRLSWEVTPYKDREIYKDDDQLETEMIMLTSERYPYLALTKDIVGDQNRVDKTNGPVIPPQKERV